jgi:hypothetical protein
VGFRDGDLCRMDDGGVTEYDDNGTIEFGALIDVIEETKDLDLAVYYLRRALEMLAREGREKRP